MTDSRCPHCDADLCGEALSPEALASGRYGTETTHFSRTIGVEIPGVYDGVLFWRCPDCGGSWHRWPAAMNLRMYEQAAKYVGTPAQTSAALDAWARSMGLEAGDD